MGFLDSIKNFFTGGSSTASTSTPVASSAPVTFGLPKNSSVLPSPNLSNQTTTPAVGKFSPAPNMSTVNGAVFAKPPTKFTLNEDNPVFANELDKPTTNLNEVQSAVTNGSSQSTGGAGFRASDNKGIEDDGDSKGNENKELSVRDQIQQGMLDMLGKDSSEEKSRLREEAGIEEKSKTSNRILNQLRTMRVDFEAKKDELENENNRGRSMGAINNEINKLTKNTNRNLAYKSIEHDIANNDLRSAEATVNDRIQDMKDEDAKQIQLYKTLYDFVQDDMSESEKLEAQQAFSSSQSELGFERQKELASYNSLLRKDEARLTANLRSAVTAQEQADAQKAVLPSLREKAGDLTSALSDLTNGKTGNIVGSNPFARMSLTRGFSGEAEGFIASIDQLTSRETLDTLIALKAKGGTLGALSSTELDMLERSASKIGTWRKSNDEGETTHYDTTEALFAKELKTLRTLTNKAIVNAGGEINADPLGLGVGQADPLNLGI